jgi:hypothetical protein
MSYRQILSIGRVKAFGVEVFNDQACTINATQINWGMVSPGETKNYTLYARNPGNVPITLTLATTGWQPANATLFITLSWTYNGSVIAPAAVIPLTFQLAVIPSISGIDNFSFTIIITGVESA